MCAAGCWTSLIIQSLWMRWRDTYTVLKILHSSLTVLVVGNIPKNNQKISSWHTTQSLSLSLLNLNKCLTSFLVAMVRDSASLIVVMVFTRYTISHVLFLPFKTCSLRPFIWAIISKLNRYIFSLLALDTFFLPQDYWIIQDRKCKQSTQVKQHVHCLLYLKFCKK